MSGLRRMGSGGTSPDRGKLRGGFAGLLRGLWFIVALVLYAVGYLLHFIGSLLIYVSGLTRGSQQLPQPTTLASPVPRHGTDVGEPPGGDGAR